MEIDSQGSVAVIMWEELLTPEERLLVAIFCVALKDYLCPEAYLSQDDKRTAKAYFELLRHEDFGSFGHFCDTFGFEPLEIRKLVLTEDMIEVLKTLKLMGERGEEG